MGTPGSDFEIHLAQMTRLLFAPASSHNSVQFLAWRRGRVFNPFLVSISIEVRMIAALGLNHSSLAADHWRLEFIHLTGVVGHSALQSQRS